MQERCIPKPPFISCGKFKLSHVWILGINPNTYKQLFPSGYQLIVFFPILGIFWKHGYPGKNIFSQNERKNSMECGQSRFDGCK
jgi:hypothetical protein